jgi:hypothetical protein
MDIYDLLDFNNIKDDSYSSNKNYITINIHPKQLNQIIIDNTFYINSIENIKKYNIILQHNNYDGIIFDNLLLLEYQKNNNLNDNYVNKHILKENLSIYNSIILKTIFDNENFLEFKKKFINDNTKLFIDYLSNINNKNNKNYTYDYILYNVELINFLIKLTHHNNWIIYFIDNKRSFSEHTEDFINRYRKYYDNYNIDFNKKTDFIKIVIPTL